MSDPVLSLRAIERSYKTPAGPLRVLNGVDIDLAKGELVALVAPSGAGKSTLLHVAGLLERPDGGDVILNGSSCGKMRDDARTAMRRSSIGFVYQFHHLMGEFSAIENVMLPLMIAGAGKRQARERAHELLASVGLENRETHRPARLSGGEQQRVAIARAIANDPAVLLADEPTGNLDPETADHVFDILVRSVREKGLTALIATHNLELASRMDRILRLSGGKVEAA